MQQRWNLVADVGGTNARFAVAVAGNIELQCMRRFSVAEYENFSDAFYAYLREVRRPGFAPRPDAACLAVASVVGGEAIQFTNSAWSLDRKALSEHLGTPIQLINDFVAVGYGITRLSPADWFELRGGDVAAGHPIAVLGAGTGLGMCILVPVDAGYQIIDGEGGHVDFAPVDAREIAVLQCLDARFGRVSVERLLSGPGILNIYSALAEMSDQAPAFAEPAAITAAALKGDDSLAVEALQMFCRILGSTAGNLALTAGARGGVYIAGGIAPRIWRFLTASEFSARFEAKGRFSDYVRDIPVRLVTREHIGLEGALVCLHQGRAKEPAERRRRT